MVAEPRQLRSRSIRVLATGLVAGLVCLLLTSATATLVVRIRNASAQHTLATRYLPAQAEAVALQSAYIDQETSERGYLLTGDNTYLVSYQAGQRDARRLESDLRDRLAGDPAARALLGDVTAAYRTWQQESASPEIAKRAAGQIPQAELDDLVRAGKQRFDVLRTRLDNLSARTARLTAGELSLISDRQLVADIVTAVTVALALVAAALAIPVSRRILTRPLDRVLGQVQTVASGDYAQPIEPQGGAELVAMGAATEEMRQSLIRRSEELVRAQHALTLRTERDRLAADLHDRTIQRAFALGLSLSALANRFPDQAPWINPLIDETDRCIRELRAIVFNIAQAREMTLRQGVEEVVGESARALGFAPHLEIRGPVDGIADPGLTVEVLAVLREALSNVLRHAKAGSVDILLGVETAHLELRVSDDGLGMALAVRGNGLRNIEARAVRLGGTASLRDRSGGGTTMEWRVPLTGLSSAVELDEPADRPEELATPSDGTIGPEGGPGDASATGARSG